jgi:hypothetical protein
MQNGRMAARRLATRPLSSTALAGQFGLAAATNAGVGLGVRIAASDQLDFLFVELFNENFINHRRLLLFVGGLPTFWGLSYGQQKVNGLNSFGRQDDDAKSGLFQKETSVRQDFVIS